MVEFLILQKGADPNIPGRYRSETFVLLKPYSIAIKKKRLRVAKFLLDYGTRLDLYTAAFLGKMDIIESRLDKDPESVNELQADDSVWNVTALHHAIAGEQVEVAGALIAQGADVKAHSELLLDIACRLGRMDLIQLLIQAGADPTQVEVFSVIYTGSTDIMKFFFSQGVDVNKKGTATKWPPIAYVSRGDKGEHPEKVKALIQFGADVNALGPKGVTALHAAAKAGFESVIDLLIESGADINAKTDLGETPLALSLRHKRLAATDILKRNGA